MATVSQPVREADEVRDLNVGAQRMCVIHLREEYVDVDGNPKAIVLPWHTGKMSAFSVGSKMRKTLRPGESFRTTLERAQSWFGLFTLPHMLESVYDETKRATLLEQYQTEKRRAIMAWGEYPRGNTGGNTNNNGGNVIGPARIPPVVLTVEEADGEQWAPVDLRELYGLGEYYDVQTGQMPFKPGPDRTGELEAQLKEMRLNQAKLEGMLMQFNAQNNAKAAREHGPDLRGKTKTEEAAT